ncbi:ABC transporter permease [Nitratireductor sp. ZSWI3]|uniref:ABC transporter permease n=1 Tax=Nitratireductor sp. ZSWI3 TaxID=2966359 RepID=UPI00215012DF|nr:ABC transporter permease [Nitratireductor sp. ZSWI3]MCR4265226.1 ABC transporter permease [Nitratireductor sp. ZSWI3]
MLAFLIRRIGQSAVVVLLMATIVFFGVNLVGDPVHMLVSPEADQAEIARVIQQFGLDRPIVEQYWLFLKGAVQGNLGTSFIFGQPAVGLILERLPATMELAVCALVLAVFFGIPLGVYSGIKPKSRVSQVIMAASIFGFSLPTFWVGIMLIMFFSVQLQLLPSTGRGEVGSFLGIDSSLFTLDGLKHIILPATNLALLKMSMVIRLSRAGTREVMQQDYIKFARAKGLSFGRIVWAHLLKNIMIPVITVLGLEFGSLIAFSVVTESIFAWPGMGKLLIDSVLQLDRPVIVAYLMIVVFLFVAINLVVDVIYSLLDPRVSLTGAKS